MIRERRDGEGTQAGKEDAEREERGRQDDVVELFKRTKPQRLADAKKLQAVMA